jgi:hypothetical protein
MPFREKSAWVMGIFFLVVLAYYVAKVQPISWRTGTATPPFGPAVWLASVTIVGSIIIQAVIGSKNPREAAAPADERERQILARSSHHSGVLLGFGCIAALINYLVHSNGDLLFHGIILSLLFSAVVECALQVFFFRRGH